MMFKKIRLVPTLFPLDVWVSDNLDELAQGFSEKYGESVSYYKEELRPNATQIISSTVSSESKGETVIVMNISAIDEEVVVHEIIHVLFKLSEYTGIEVGVKSQEWCAYFVSDLFSKIIEKPD